LIIDSGLSQFREKRNVTALSTIYPSAFPQERRKMLRLYANHYGYAVPIAYPARSAAPSFVASSDAKREGEIIISNFFF